MSAAVTESVYMLPDGRELARPQQAGLACSSILTAVLVHDHMPRMRLATPSAQYDNLLDTERHAQPVSHALSAVADFIHYTCVAY